MYHLLIVENEANERSLIRYLLTDFSHKVIVSEAQNGKEALEILQSAHHDIIITDVQMPYVNGIELASKAKEMFPDIEIVFISGYDDFSYVHSALILKVANYILKPVDRLDFHKTLNNILNRLDCRSLEQPHLERYTLEGFNDLTEKFCISSNQLPSPPAEPAEEDYLLLQKMNSAVSYKQPELLQTSFYCLMQKYIHRQDVSHIYIRYICTSVLQILTSYGQLFLDNNFEQVAGKIFSFHHFSDICSLLEEYLQKVVADMQQETDSPHYAISKIVEYIQKHYAEPLTLNQLADLVYLSPNYLSNIFVKAMGVNINKYIRHVRIKKASTMLADTNMKIADISSQVGYPNTSYFCKLFQEEFGISPEKFRNANRK